MLISKIWITYVNYFLKLGDEVNSKGEKRVRKNVQFEILKNFDYNTEELMKKVLEPIPEQIKEYYK